MKCFYISIEKNLDIFEIYKSLWEKHGVEGIRIDSMTEGIKKAIEIEQSTSCELCFIAIVSSDVDYLPQLKILSEETNASIMIATFNYNEEEHQDVLNNGADFYGQYSNEPDSNIKFVLSVMNNIDQRNKKRKAPNRVTLHNDILIVDGHNKVFVKDKEIHLTNAELKALRYLAINRRSIVSHRQLHNQIKSHSPDEPAPSSIYNIMKRLRRKLRDATQLDYIETVRNFGYRLK